MFQRAKLNKKVSCNKNSKNLDYVLPLRLHNIILVLSSSNQLKHEFFIFNEK